MASVYKITNLINDHKYVGKTERKPEERWKEHIYLSKYSPEKMTISNAINKHGKENFKFEVIEECSSEKVNDREIFWISELNTYKDGYNSTIGGDGNAGTPRKRGAVVPWAKPVDMYTIKGEYESSFGSLDQAAWYIAKSKHCEPIKKNIKGQTNSAFGHRWAWKGGELAPVKSNPNGVEGGDAPVTKIGVWGINLKTGAKKYWKRPADCWDDLMGKRDSNYSYILKHNSKEGTEKRCLRGWYIFRERDKVAGDHWKEWEPCKRKGIGEARPNYKRTVGYVPPRNKS
jgi:hypothetical protein